MAVNKCSSLSVSKVLDGVAKINLVCKEGGGVENPVFVPIYFMDGSLMSRCFTIKIDNKQM